LEQLQKSFAGVQVMMAGMAKAVVLQVVGMGELPVVLLQFLDLISDQVRSPYKFQLPVHLLRVGFLQQVRY
jgi:hypothetical protein